MSKAKEDDWTKRELEHIRMGAWFIWFEPDRYRSNNKRNAAIAMARYLGNSYARIGRGAGISGTRVRQICFRAKRKGWRLVSDAEDLGSYIAEGNRERVLKDLSAEGFKKLFVYCEVLKNLKSLT